MEGIAKDAHSVLICGYAGPFQRSVWRVGTLILGVILYQCAFARVFVIAHRGGAFEAPENTMAAFRRDAPIADYAEMDAQTTVDNHLVIIHDDFVDRTTNGTGAVTSLTLAEISQLDAGSKFSPQYAGERIPTAEQVLTEVQRSVPLMFERKSGSVSQYVDLLSRIPLRDDSYLHGFDYDFLVAFHKQMPNVRLAWDGGGTLSDAQMDAAVAAGISVFSWSGEISPDFVQRAHSRGAMVFAWTIDDAATAEAAIAVGVDAIITDLPTLMSKLPETSPAPPIFGVGQIGAVVGSTVALNWPGGERSGRTATWYDQANNVIGAGPTVSVTAGAGSVTYMARAGSQSYTFRISPTEALSGQIAQLSARVRDDASGPGIVGFILESPHTVLVRGLGPSLKAFGVLDAVGALQFGIAEPLMSTEWLTVPWWKDTSMSQTFARVGAFPLQPNSSDYAIERSFAAGRHTFLLRHDANAANGVAMAEVYSDDGQGSATFSDISVRSVASSAAPVIAGFVVTNAADTLLIRAAGPALAAFAVSNPLSDPVLTVYDANHNVVAYSDDWTTQGSAPVLAAVSAKVGAFPFAYSSKDAAVLVTLPPGAYTAVVSPAGSSAGALCLLEVYTTTK